MRPDLAPTACLPLEADEARCLLWLPLAVRHKLDSCALRLSLADWQALSMAARLQLLQLRAGSEFAMRAVEAGATHDTRLRKPVRCDAAQVAQALDCKAAAAQACLTAATPFAQYALVKLSKTGRAWAGAADVPLQPPTTPVGRTAIR